MGIERTSRGSLILVGAQCLFEVVALGRVGVGAGVEDLGDRAPPRPAGQGVLFGGGGVALLALERDKRVDGGKVGGEPGLGA